MRYKILDDEPIVLTEENDFIGTKVYADELIDLCKSDQIKSIETVALFAPWGSGKSSIINTLKNELDKNKETFKFLVYDAWKYNKDDFKKSLLIDICRSKKETKKIEREIYEERTTSSINFSKPLQIVLGLIVLVIIGFILMKLDFLNQDVNKAQFQIALALVTLLLGNVVLQFLFNQVTVNSNKKFTSQDFNDRFHDLVNNQIEQNKLIIVVDNLDRCDDDKIYEIIDSLKHFTKRSSTSHTFILPIDKNRLNKDESQEYIQKVFDYILTVKITQKYDLYDLVKDINDKNVFEISDRGLNLIADYYANTPRHLKKFLNEFNHMRMLRDRSKAVESDDEHQNDVDDERTLKLLLIKELFPKEYSLLCKHPQFFDDEEAQKSIMAQVNHKDGVSYRSSFSPDFNRFIADTKDIPLRDVTPLLYLRSNYKDIDREVGKLIRLGDLVKLKSYLADNDHQSRDIFKVVDREYKKYITDMRQYWRVKDFTNSILCLINQYGNCKELHSVIKAYTLEKKLNAYCNELTTQYGVTGENAYLVSLTELNDFENVNATKKLGLSFIDKMVKISTKAKRFELLHSILGRDRSFNIDNIDRELLALYINESAESDINFKDIEQIVLSNHLKFQLVFDKTYAKNIVEKSYWKSLEFLCTNYPNLLSVHQDTMIDKIDLLKLESKITGDLENGFISDGLKKLLIIYDALENDKKEKVKNLFVKWRLFEYLNQHYQDKSRVTEKMINDYYLFVMKLKKSFELDFHINRLLHKVANDNSKYSLIEELYNELSEIDDLEPLKLAEVCMFRSNMNKVYVNDYWEYLSKTDDILKGVQKFIEFINQGSQTIRTVFSNEGITINPATYVNGFLDTFDTMPSNIFICIFDNMDFNDIALNEHFFKYLSDSIDKDIYECVFQKLNQIERESLSNDEKVQYDKYKSKLDDKMIHQLEIPGIS